MPHQRKYVPSHSGGTESQPSRAKRSISACASQGFNSRLSRSTRCAFVSFTASLIGPSRNAKAGRRCDSQPVPRPVVFGFVVALPRVTSSEGSPGVRQTTLYIARTWIPTGRASAGSSLFSDGKVHIVDRDCQEEPPASV